jgi:hypothetical protein
MSSESARIARLKNLMIYTNIIATPSTKHRALIPYETYNTFRVGAVEAVTLPVNEITGSYDLASALLKAFDTVLLFAASTNLGPTKSSRLYYMWFFSVAAAFQRVDTRIRVSGIKDAWNWNIRHSVRSEQERCIWMLCVLEVVMGKLGISYIAPWSELSEVYALRDATVFGNEKIAAKTAGRFDEWIAAYEAWFASRTADGSVAAAVPPSDSELPNGDLRLDVAETIDPSTFAQPDLWTPLQIGSTTQKYMTYNWGSVRSPAGLSETDELTVFEAADTMFPSSAEAREIEIAEVVGITAGLTDEQKVSAEFWAGGPFTVSPPGMLLWMWKHYVSGQTASKIVYSGLDLSLHLFETGRLVWGLKKAHLQCRPIQDIRRLYRGISVTRYDGTTILGESWVPYQETNFVTPPFADFPSGHSAFSHSFAAVMTRWFGASIERRVISMTDIALISPALSPQHGEFGTFVFEAGKSLIQTGVVPSTPMTLRWDTWSAMAESAGISRKYGGIHATSAHTGSVAAATVLHALLETRFPINCC